MEAQNVLEKVVGTDDGRAQKLVAGATLLIAGIIGMKENPKTAILKTLAGGFLVYKGIEGLDWNDVLNKLEASQKNNPLIG
jgi:hypothetical protein